MHYGQEKGDYKRNAHRDLYREPIVRAIELDTPRMGIAANALRGQDDK